MTKTTATGSDQLAEIKAWLATERAQHPSDPGGNYLPGAWADWLVAEVERLRSRLATLEWAATPEPNRVTARCCPACEIIRPGRHAPTCWIALAINAERDG